MNPVLDLRNLVNLTQLEEMANRTDRRLDALEGNITSIDIPTKVSDLTNDAGYQTSEEVDAAINAKVAAAYIPRGTYAFADLPTPSADTLNSVYDVSDGFTTTGAFVEGAGKVYGPGMNVAVVERDGAYMFDVLGQFVDLTPYQEKEAGKGLSTNDFTNEDKAKLAGISVATDDQVREMLDRVFGA